MLGCGVYVLDKLGERDTEAEGVAVVEGLGLSDCDAMGEMEGMLGCGVNVLDKGGEHDTEAIGVVEAVMLGAALLEGTPTVAEGTAENEEEGEVHGVAVEVGGGVPEDGRE